MIGIDPWHKRREPSDQDGRVNRGPKIPVQILSEAPKPILDRLDKVATALRATGKYHPSVYLSAADVRSWTKLPEGRERLFPELSQSQMSGSQWDRSANLFAALCCWRRTQFIYTFDATLYQELSGSPVNDLPASALMRLPASCVWMEVLGMPGGWFALLDDTESGPELTLMAFDDDPKMVCKFHLRMDMSLSDAVDLAVGDTNQMLPPELVAIAMPNAKRMYGSVVSALMYLCSEEQDILCEKRSKLNDRQLARGKVAFHPTEFQAGHRIGAALRKYREARIDSAPADACDGRSVVPHMRRAHWHTFLKGPRDTERERVVKWLPPIPVNLAPGAQPIAVVRAVKR